MRSSRQVLEIDRVDFFAISYCTVACIVSKAVLDSDDNPDANVSIARRRSQLSQLTRDW